MKLYVCWGTFKSPRPGGHPCGNAHRALKEAGHDPELVHAHGLALGPKLFHQTSTKGRQEVFDLTGQHQVPVLVTDDGEAIADSKRIVEWAQAHPAAA